MKLDRLYMVNRIDQARRALLYQISMVEKEPVNHWCLTIDAARMDEPMHCLIRPLVLTELRARLAELDRDLEKLGVEIE